MSSRYYCGATDANDALPSPEEGVVPAELPGCRAHPSKLSSRSHNNNSLVSMLANEFMCKGLMCVAPDTDTFLDPDDWSIKDFIEVEALPADLYGVQPASANRMVSFGSVGVREFNRIAGDHPECRTGPPMSIDWNYVEQEPVPINQYESRRRRGVFTIPGRIRKEILKSAFHVPDKDIRAAEPAVSRTAKKRNKTRRMQKISKRTRNIVDRVMAPFRMCRKRRQMEDCEHDTFLSHIASF